MYCTDFNVVYSIVLYCTLMYCTLFYSIVLYNILLYYTILYFIVLYYTILYCIVLYLLLPTTHYPLLRVSLYCVLPLLLRSFYTCSVDSGPSAIQRSLSAPLHSYTAGSRERRGMNGTWRSRLGLEHILPSTAVMCT